MALDLILKSLISTAHLSEFEDINWNGVAKHIPGVTAKQCEQRYQELRQAQVEGKLAADNKTAGLIKSSAKAAAGDSKISRPMSKNKTQEKTIQSSNLSKGDENKRIDSEDKSPVMVIHVCDEAKNLKQDFHCQRDLLVHEMRYFAEYLSTDAQRWEDVDISVHCDVQIFDWLMKYVKRDHTVDQMPEGLEPSNVISILISSDFLKMDSLVEKCIQYCHINMNEIIATPCNMNCINDRLVTRIASLFNHNEANDIKDRKDKFKSKIFAKKVEKLFDPRVKSQDSNECAASLFRCSICNQLMTTSLEKKIRCLPKRMTINSDGSLSYAHEIDSSWDVNEYLITLKSTLKSWRDVYWRLWGQINHLECTRCKEAFQCLELGHCRYHPEGSSFDSISVSGLQVDVLGTYPCCDQKALRFDPTSPNTGCKVRDHIIKTDNGKDDESNLSGRIYQDLLAHRDLICIPFQPKPAVSQDDLEFNILRDSQVLSSASKSSVSSIKQLDSSIADESLVLKSESKPKFEPLTVEKEMIELDGSHEDEGNQDDKEWRRPQVNTVKRIIVDQKAILCDPPEFGVQKSKKWDSTKSLRWNQDSQREDDNRRMNEMVQFLCKLRQTNDRGEKYKPKECQGGLFCKLEAQFKSTNVPPPRGPGQLTRTKTKTNQMKPM